MKKYIHFIIFIIFISVSSSAGAQTEKTPAFPVRRVMPDISQADEEVPFIM